MLVLVRFVWSGSSCTLTTGLPELPGSLWALVPSPAKVLQNLPTSAKALTRLRSLSPGNGDSWCQTMHSGVSFPLDTMLPNLLQDTAPATAQAGLLTLNVRLRQPASRTPTRHSPEPGLQTRGCRERYPVSQTNQVPPGSQVYVF